ncbi:MAG: efflux RND transporter permease subunit, partial [Aquabacterium sp.]|nr:efflux RND transporter permease subunit [Aquabacterium sp.]
MWFTRLSIHNPVMATMVMMALVVLGLFSYQRLKVDQFPDIELPTLAIQLDYPGASPEIIESEVTRKVEEAVNTVAGINQLYSRSYEGSSVVIVQFNLDVDGRRAADDVREKLSAIRPTLRDEVKEPRVLRFDPANRPIFSLALTSPDSTQSEQALTTYADQILRKRLENVRGVGSVNLVGARKRQVNVYLKPQAMQALGLRAEQVANAVRLENQDQPAGSVRTKMQDRVVQIDARLKTVRDFERLIVATRGGQPIRLNQVADVVDGPQELDTLALYNGKRTLALEVLKAQGENTLDVVKGLREVITQVSKELPPGMKVDVIRDNSRPIAVSVSTVRETLIEGAVLTVAIVFLFLNSWRSTVITGLTLPISIIGTFLFMYAFGFSINMITLMALSLCVGLLID